MSKQEGSQTEISDEELKVLQELQEDEEDREEIEWARKDKERLMEYYDEK